jgi:hypothetical protein
MDVLGGTWRSEGQRGDKRAGQWVATQLCGGGGGIRTHEDVAALPHFECGALGRAMRLHPWVHAVT